ncbi:hypothetical protein ACI7BZ_10440 [Xanthobacter sp. AM11]|uniref:hypothetical protein n=1 Tax=Xanthobacter sp. AM11 TaxID=3380643 RepID=UPI0039BF4DDB
MTNDAGPIIQARLHDGMTLPVVDVTNPVFRIDESPTSLDRLRASIVSSVNRPAAERAATPGPMPDLLQRMFAPQAQYLDGLATYLLKIGADNLPAQFDTEIERRLASSPNAVALRIRLQQLSRLMARALRNAPPSAPLRLLAIGGGTAIEALNALIILKGDSGNTISDVAVDMLDIEDTGIPLGKAVLAALCETKGPLAGIAATMTFVPYSWDQPSSLASALHDRMIGGEYVLASSEGALFEYGSDRAVIANLSLLREAGAIPIAGSVIRDDATGQAMAARSPFPLKARGLRNLESLVSAAGYRISDAIEGVASDQFLLHAD